MARPKVALTHEFVTQFGGAEKVLRELLALFPEAPIFTLVYDPDKARAFFGKRDFRGSFLQYLPGAQNFHRWFLPFMPWATESLNFKGYDIVIADASAFAKGVKVSKDTLLICYCHTPTRYLWLESKSYVDSLRYPIFIKKLIPPLLRWLRRWDLKAAARPHHYIANSQTVAERIKKFYNRDSEVVYPPIDTNFFRPFTGKQDYFFTASRLEPYKKMELIVQAFNELGLPLKVAGSGTSSESLRRLAKPNIEFLGRVTDEELRRRMTEAKAFVFAANEDAGIVPVEAMSCGTPVIAYKAGGSLETVVEGKTGLFFSEQSAESIKEAVLRFKSEDFDSAAIRAHAQQYDKEIFKAKIWQLVEQWYAEFKNRG